MTVKTAMTAKTAMNRIRRTARTLACLVSLATGAATATPALAQSAAMTVAAGMSLQPPQGWRAQAAGADKIVLVAPDGNTTFIAMLTFADAAAVMRQLTTPVNLGNNVTLTPVRQPYVAADYLANDFAVTGTTAPATGLVTIRRFTDGRALAIVGIAPQQNGTVLRTMQYRLMAAVQVSAKQPDAANSLATELRGRYLVRFYSGNGYHERQEIWLCSNGVYAMRASGGGATRGLASGAFNGGHQGRWQSAGQTGSGVLALTDTQGRNRSFQISVRNDGVYLNGTRWLRGANKHCQ
ncbi:MAG: hypothetical protein KDJ29_03390 [Hyphomicrobiales bacterium]|nr:hypothetical protein [Hyphomicrobiales bacterium]